jgi:hypothetical protein
MLSVFLNRYGFFLECLDRQRRRIQKIKLSLYILFEICHKLFQPQPIIRHRFNSLRNLTHYMLQSKSKLPFYNIRQAISLCSVESDHPLEYLLIMILNGGL